jgi:uncharacterized protein YjbI with pentapeptide repeats
VTASRRKHGISAADFSSYERLTSLALADEAQHEGVVFEHADVRAATAEHVELTDIWLQSVDARDGTLPRLVARDTLVADCDLSNSRWLGASLVWVDLVGCRATGFDLTEATLRHVTFRDCKLDLALFRFMHTESVSFVDCILTGADFSGATLAGARFDNCDLSGADLSYADLDRADLRTSRLDSVRGVGSLRGATIGANQLVTLASSLATELGRHVEADDGA